MLAKRLKLLREKQGKGQQEVCAALNIVKEYPKLIFL